METKCDQNNFDILFYLTTYLSSSTYFVITNHNLTNAKLDEKIPFDIIVNTILGYNFHFVRFNVYVVK